VARTRLSLTSRAVSSKATETPFTSKACPDSGALEEVSHDHRAGRAKRAKPGRAVTPYLEVETQPISSLERMIVRELAQGSHATQSKKRKDGDQSSSIRTGLVEVTRFGGL
jgi:hypothetical protein